MSHIGVTMPHDQPSSPSAVRRLLTKLWFWILVAITAGIIVGFTAPGTAKELKWLADAFIQLIKTVAAPVIFCTVVVGVASLGNLRKVGKLAGITLVYFFVATTVCLALGLLAANLVKPGAGFAGAPSTSALKTAQADLTQGTGGTSAVHFVTDDVLPKSFLQPFVDNAILPVLVLAILFACATSLLAPPLRARVISGVESISKVVFGIIRIVMFAAPLGAFGGMAYTVGQFGGATLKNLGVLMVTFWATCAIFVFVILGVVTRVSGFSIFKFIRMIKDELLIVLGTSSSETVLPRFLAKLESAGASRRVVSLTVPTGYSFNLDGTCIYLTMAALFIAQAGGTHLPLGAQLGLLGLMVLMSKGAAGVSGASVVTLAASLQAFGPEFFPPATLAIGIALVVGIDRVMSEGKALTSIIGVSAGTMVIAKLAGERDDERFHAALNDPSIVRDAIEREPLDDEATAPATEHSREPEPVL
ncbi:cation:dicarboxylate symporter family transporter [Amycolatopsis pigmentata]|uniref:Cation:dicarboxylate symporter family transporter n=1 Tax=Amycolatopsis pigmentata TaxID=450801 RepID=A0ABW5FKC4_9PSEU